MKTKIKVQGRKQGYYREVKGYASFVWFEMEHWPKSNHWHVTSRESRSMCECGNRFSLCHPDA